MLRFKKVVCGGVLTVVAVIAGLTAPGANAQTVAANRASTGNAAPVARIAREVRHELVMLPYYGVFDWLEGNVSPDGVVTLRGQVVRPTTKSDAVARVRDIEDVRGVNDQIEVLPLSPNDDRIRLAVYRKLFNFNSPLFTKYGTRAVPPIHIIVRNGNVTLKGIVDSSFDKNIANTYARTVPGVFSVTNDLVVEGNATR